MHIIRVALLSFMFNLLKVYVDRFLFTDTTLVLTGNNAVSFIRITEKSVELFSLDISE